MIRADDPDVRPVIPVLATLGDSLVGVEVGVCNGDNAARLLGALPIGKLYLVDPWGGYDQDGYHCDFEASYPFVAGRFSADQRVEIMRMDSATAAPKFQDGSLDFIYIDACHEEGPTRGYIEEWLPKVRRGGILCGHDFAWGWLGVVRAILRAAHEHDWDLQTRTADWWVVIP